MNDTPNSDNRGHYQPMLFGLLTGMFCWILLDWRISFETALWMWLIVMGCLMFRFTMAIYAVTGISLIAPLLSVRRSFARLVETSVSTGDIMFAFTLLGFIYFGFRLVDSLPRGRSSKSAGAASRVDRYPEPGPGPGLIGAALIPVATLAAVTLLGLFPENAASRQIIRLTPGGLRAVTFIWLLGAGWIVIISGYGMIGWFRLNARQAALYVRSCFAREIGAELGRIERARARHHGETGPGL